MRYLASFGGCVQCCTVIEPIVSIAVLVNSGTVTGPVILCLLPWITVTVTYHLTKLEERGKVTR